MVTLRAENVKLLTENTELKSQVAELQLELVQRNEGVSNEGEYVDAGEVDAGSAEGGRAKTSGLNPRLALDLIDNHRSSAVVERVLVTDIYAAYGRLNADKQKCLTHLLRELFTLRKDLPQAAVDAFIQPVMTLFQDAIALGKHRNDFDAPAFDQRRQHMEDQLDALIFSTDC